MLPFYTIAISSFVPFLTFSIVLLSLSLMTIKDFSVTILCHATAIITQTPKISA
jgi:hypothetical protein